MKFLKMLREEKRDFELFSKQVDKGMEESKRAQKRTHEENQKFSQQIERNILNHSK